MKRKPKKRRPKKTNWKKKADDMWSLVIRNHYQKCEICGKPGELIQKGYNVGGLNAHHVIGRMNLLFRHDLRNGQCLCTGCHRYSRTCSPHAGSVIGVTGYIEWMQQHKKEQWAWFNENKFEKGKPDKTFEEIYYELKEILNTGDMPPY